LIPLIAIHRHLQTAPCTAEVPKITLSRLLLILRQPLPLPQPPHPMLHPNFPIRLDILGTSPDIKRTRLHNLKPLEPLRFSLLADKGTAVAAEAGGELVTGFLDEDVVLRRAGEGK
jgi:hypothetical protein